MDDNEFWVRVNALVVLFLITLTICGFGYSYLVTKAALENSYEEVMLPGQRSTSWQKVR